MQPISTEPQQPQNNNIFSIENSSNKELGKQIRQEIDRLTREFMELDDQENKIILSKKSIILEIADKFERLQEIGEYPFPVHRIADGVLKHLQRNGYNISKDYVYEVIKKNAPQYISTSYDSVSTLPIDIKIYQQKVIEALDTSANLKPELMRREQIQDLIEKCYQTIDILEDYASENNILVHNNKQETTIPHYDSEELDPFKDPVITDKPESRISNFYTAGLALGESIVKFGQTIIDNAKMSKDYPPEIDDNEAEIYAVKRMVEWKNWWDILAEAMKGGTDRKYRRSIVQWVKIADDENDWGKHAASSKNPYTARFRDPKTGEWKEEIRKLTREQIGDKSPKVRKFVNMLRNTVPACLDFIRWSEFYLHPFTNGESVKLSGKLSDRSLR